MEMLTRKNIHPSVQRLKILEVLLEGSEHPTAAMIHERVSREIPTISKTTVYNTLDTFAQKGLIQCLTIKPEESRYDGVAVSHHHLLCKRCGAIIDIDVCCEYAQKKEIDGHLVEEVHGYFKGVCRECRLQGESLHNK